MRAHGDPFISHEDIGLEAAGALPAPLSGRQTLGALQKAGWRWSARRVSNEPWEPPVLVKRRGPEVMFSVCHAGARRSIHLARGYRVGGSGGTASAALRSPDARSFAESRLAVVGAAGVERTMGTSCVGEKTGP